MKLSLKEISEIDFNGLPDEALKAIYREAHAVLSRRRLSVKASAHQMMVLKNASHDIRSPHRLKEFEYLKAQDWTHLYPEQDGERKFYVYAHVEKFKTSITVDGVDFGGLPFYVGKGTGARAYDLKRNEGHGVILKKLLNSGRTASDIVVIFKDGLTESEALCLESKLIYFLGTRFEGRKNGILINLDRPKVPGYCSVK